MSFNTFLWCGCWGPDRASPVIPLIVCTLLSEIIALYEEKLNLGLTILSKNLQVNVWQVNIWFVHFGPGSLIFYIYDFLCIDLKLCINRFKYIFACLLYQLHPLPRLWLNIKQTQCSQGDGDLCFPQKHCDIAKGCPVYTSSISRFFIVLKKRLFNI